MNIPFEGILGNCDELKMIEYLLPLEDIEFSLGELSQDLNISEHNISRIIDKFVGWNIIKSISNRDITYYCMNHESPIVKSIEHFNNTIIEHILGDEILYEIHDYLEEKKHQLEIIDKSSCSNGTKTRKKLISKNQQQ